MFCGAYSPIIIYSFAANTMLEHYGQCFKSYVMGVTFGQSPGGKNSEMLAIVRICYVEMVKVVSIHQ